MKKLILGILLLGTAAFAGKIDVGDDGSVCWISGDTSIPLGRFTFEVYRNDFHHKALAQESLNSGGVFECSGDAAKDSRLSVAFEQTGDDSLRVAYRIGYNGPAEGLFKPRFRFEYPKSGLLTRPEDTKGSRSGDQRVLMLDYGPVRLQIKSLISDFGWVGIGGKSSLPMNMDVSKGVHLEDREIIFDLQIIDVDAGGFVESMQAKVRNAKADAEAYLSAWRSNPALPETDFPDLGKMSLPELNVDRAAAWKAAQDFSAASDQLIGQVQNGLVEHRDAFYAQAKKFNDQMHFKVGLSYDADPMDRLDKWALFNLNFFRISTLSKWLGDEAFEPRLKKVQAALNQAAEFGATAIVTVQPDIDPKGSAEIPFSHDLLPVLRPSFYKPSFTSARHRAAWVEEGLQWMDATADLNNIFSFKIGNEPFWSSRPAPAYGYGIGGSGCSAETFRTQLLAKYGSFAAWRKQADRTPMGSEIPWQSLEEISLPAGSIRGLTFIDYLREKYSSLDELNHSWSSAFSSWDEVYPPLPADSGEIVMQEGSLPTFDLAEEADSDKTFLRPAVNNIAAWTDWGSYWPVAVNDQLSDIYSQLKEKHPTRKVSVNCITGQFINNYLGAGADTGLNPWITSDGLDDLSIDFYSLAYMQAYLRALDSVDDRPVIIQETAGAEPVKATCMAMYSFAWGADGLLFWRRDHELPPRVCLELSQAQKAMVDSDLQHASKPVSDGVATLYSFASLRLADAETGDAGAYLDAWQAESLLLSRLGVLYDVHSDRQWENGVLENVKVLFCPSALALSDEVFQTLEKFVEQGGCLVASDRFAQRDAVGRPRDARRVAALLSSPNVMTIPFENLIDLHESMSGIDHSLRPWDGHFLPAWSRPVETFLQKHAPSTVHYSDYVLPAARESADALYVFVDPWAKDVTVSAEGSFSRVMDLFSRQEFDLDSVKVSGPAILKFERSFPKPGPMKVGTNFKTKLDRLEKDLAIIDDFGFESVRMGSLPFESETGDYSFPEVETVATELLKRPVDLLFSMDARPLTTVDRFPEMFNNPQALLTDQNGRLLFQQSFRNFNFNHPDLQKRWAEFIADFSTMASRQDIAGREVTLNFNNELHYAPRGSIVGRKPKPDETYDNASEKLHLGYSRLRKYFHPERGLVGDFTDGFHLTDYSVFTIADFQAWLETRYGTIPELNRVWGSEWSSFDVVEPPRELPFESEALDAAWMDWLQFRFIDFQELFAWVKKTNPSDIPVSHNFIAGRYLLADPFSGVDLWAMGETLDRIGMDYPDVFDLYLLSATDKPVHIIEAGVGYTADYMYHTTLLAAVGGARTINFWQRDMDYVTARSNAVTGVKQAWPLVHQLGGTMQTPNVAVLYSHQSAFADLKENASVFAPVDESASDGNDLEALTKKISGGARSFPVVDYLGRVTAAWMALMESGYAAHPIGSATLAAGKADRYEAIVVPAAVSLSDADFQTLEKYEGRLIAWGRGWGGKDEWLSPTARAEQLFACRRTGTVEGSVTVVMNGTSFAVDGCDILEPLAGAEVIARTADGQPVAVAAGDRILLGFDLLEPAGFCVYDGLAREVLNLRAFRENNSPEQIQLPGNLLRGQGLSAEVTGLPPGVWHSVLRDGDSLKLVLYDYQNWHDLWEKQFDKTICEWDGKNTQPRCLEILPGVDPNILAPSPKTFSVSVNLPGWKPRRAFFDRDKTLVEVPMVGKTEVRDMEFLYVIELGESE